MMEHRKEVTETVDAYVSLYDILDERSPDEVIQAMEMYKHQYLDRRIKFSVEPYGYDGGSQLFLIETRLENDQEYNQRIKAEKKEEERKKAAKIKAEAKELKEYERLKKKFEARA
jgi:hypothetical protein